MNATLTTLARAVGINHVALEVGDVEEALLFYAARAGASALAELAEKGMAPDGAREATPE